MENRILTNQDVKGAIDLYKSLPAATFFRGLTGHGLISESGVEKVGEITSSAGIWKPMYFFITGGERKGRTTLTAEDVKKAVEKFVENELFALLRVTTGRGIKVAGGMSQLVDIKEATAGINFELTHFGGRSIVPRMEVELSKLQDPNIKWQSGFLYQSQGNNAPAMNKNLILTRVLAGNEFDSQEKFDRVWQDIDKEVKRLIFMQCDSNSLPTSGGDNGSDRIRAFFSQELTTLVPRVQIDVRKPGYEYSIRNDGTVVVQKSVRPFEYEDEQKFAEFMAEFTKECYRVYTLYCNPLTDAQRGKLGRPVGDTHGLIETGEGEFGRDDKRSKENNESLIMWLERRGAPNFPYEGWNPEKDKEYFVFRHGWGRGYRVSPGNPRYEERITQKDDNIAARQEVRIEYDGTEKIVKEENIPLQSEDRPETGYWSDELVDADPSIAVISQKRDVWTGAYRQVVNNGEINWERQEKKDEKEETREFKISVEKIAAKSGWYEADVKEIELASYKWLVSTKGQDPDNADYSHEFSFEWEKLPKKLQKEVEQKFPVCKCGKYRYQASEHSQCYSCRDYRDCSRCGKPNQLFGADRIQAGATCCQNCSEWYEGREQWIHNQLSTNDLQKIRDNAQALLDAPAFCDFNDHSGEVLRALSDGVYTARFDDEVLAQLSKLPDSGNSLVEFIWWVVRGSKQSGLSSSYTEETVTELKNKLDAGENIVARFVRASDKVITEVEKFREVLKGFFNWNDLNIPQPNPFSDEEIQEIQSRWSDGNSGSPTQKKLDILQTLKLDLVDRVEKYRAELEAKRQTAAQCGKIWLDVRVQISTESRCFTQVFCITPNGEIVAPKEERGEGRKGRVYANFYGDLSTDHLVISYGHDNYGYRYTEWWRVDYLPKTLTYAQRMQVEELVQSRQYFVGTGTGWNLRQVGTITFTTAYSRDMVGKDREAQEEQYNSFPINVDEYESWADQDPFMPEQWEMDSGKTVVGPHKKTDCRQQRPEVHDIETVNGHWTPTNDSTMARKGWYLCPKGHSERIKGAEVGKNYTCDICDREYIVL